MKDAILKGTGDSRYLKSKIPTGTTWEQALAMLNAGTFPVDLNGINSEGFQQLGTALNKANLLKDAVVSKLGMTGDKTPNDMFGVLADCGNLHVWRKTVTTTEEVPAVPAGYTLGAEETTLMIAGTNQSYNTVTVTMTFSIGGAVATNYDGAVSLTDIETSRNTVINKSNMYGDLINYIKGKFVTVSVSGSVNFGIEGMWYIPSDATLDYRHLSRDEYTYHYEVFISKAQKVTGYPYTPAIHAGTSVTYPVSTNRNAYQEGSDAKAAGYVLGDEEAGPFDLCDTTDSSYLWEYSDSIDVTDTGAISLHSPTNIGIYRGSAASVPAVLVGKFFASRMTGVNNFGNGVIYFAPSDATISRVNPAGSSYYKYQLSKRQPVTGYPAIPAGTVIEYLGCLGDKKKLQLITYVGIGTYGESGACSITASFPIKVAIMLGYVYLNNTGILKYTRNALGDSYGVMISESLDTTYHAYCGFNTNSGGGAYGKKSADNYTFSWYHPSNAPTNQYNDTGNTYYVLAIG